MNEAGHTEAAEELRRSLARLDPVSDIRAYAELSFGIAFHYLALGCERRHGIHRDNHEGLARWLRERGHVRQAEILSDLESLRIGRWYGRQGNGDTAKRIDELLAELAAWSVA